MTLSEYFTCQFYAWEYRGRGWFVADEPIQLEPPFIPFFRHGFPVHRIDDGKRHTWVSKLLDTFNGEQTEVRDEQAVLDYATIEPFLHTDDIDLNALIVHLPRQRKSSIESMKALLTMLSNMYTPLSFEIIGTAHTITFQFVANSYGIDCLEMYMKAFFPQYSLQRSAGAIDIFKEHLPATVIDFGLQYEFVRPLQTYKSSAIDSLVGVFAVMDTLKGEEQVVIQIVFQPALNPWSESIIRSVSLYDGSSFFVDTPEAPQLATEKVKSPLYGVAIRAFAQAIDQEQSSYLLDRVGSGVLHCCKGNSNALIPLPTQQYTFQERINDIVFRESHRLGMLLNLDELISLVHFPSEHIVSTKLYATNRKTKPTPAIALNKELIVGSNLHEGISTTVTIGITERIRHTHIIGATGTGKSTLIAHMVSQDIALNNGVVVFDPHGDLIDDIIAAVPPERMSDIVLIDPSDIDYPIGVNILEAHSDSEKEVLASDLVAAFRKYATSWGDQMNAVLGNAILAMLESTHGGSLHDLRRFLLEKEFRESVLATVRDPSILYYWQREYAILKTNSIGPILTRLDTFLRPKSIRNMVVQRKGLDFDQLLGSHKIILCKLSQGLIGKENSHLLGSLLLSKIHQAIFKRQQREQRHPVFLYIDEFQHFITPSITDMLSGIRKYQAGLILSHQDLQQLQRGDGELVNSVLGNTATRIVFRVGEQDAKRLQDGFSGFESSDLQNLETGQAIIRVEQPQYDCSLETIQQQTIPQQKKEAQLKAVLIHTRENYATPKEVVEEMLASSLDVERTSNKRQPAENTTKQTAEPAPKPKESPLPKSHPTVSADEHPSPVSTTHKEEVTTSTHRYLQTLVKKMAEARGYTATLEVQLPDGSGQVDVVLVREKIAIAVEISVSTDADWEMHNIKKCITANYNIVVSISGDVKQLEKIRKKCVEGIEGFDSANVLFYTPDAFFHYLDESVRESTTEETVMKGYRINVSYDAISQEEMERKRAAVANVILQTMRKRKKNE